MNYSVSPAPQAFGHILGEFNWHKQKEKPNGCL
jgi:hypothetical protein